MAKATLTFGMDLSDFNKAMRTYQGRAKQAYQSATLPEQTAKVPPPARTQKN